MVNKLHDRIFEIAYKKRISHLSSYISAVDIIDDIYLAKALGFYDARGLDLFSHSPLIDLFR